MLTEHGSIQAVNFCMGKLWLGTFAWVDYFFKIIFWETFRGDGGRENYLYFPPPPERACLQVGNTNLIVCP